MSLQHVVSQSPTRLVTFVRLPDGRRFITATAGEQTGAHVSARINLDEEEVRTLATLLLDSVDETAKES